MDKCYRCGKKLKLPIINRDNETLERGMEFYRLNHHNEDGLLFVSRYFCAGCGMDILRGERRATE